MSTVRTIEAIQVWAGRDRIPTDAADAELLQSYVGQRDPAAFAVLVRRHGPMVLGIARRMLPTASSATSKGADPDDVFQATFFILARKAETIRKGDSLSSWLYGVAVKVAARARHHAMTRVHHERSAAAAKADSVSPETQMADWWGVIDEEIARLPDVLRQAVCACDLDGKSRRTAAAELGWPEGTVAKRLGKAREELARRLSRRGITLSATAVAAILANELKAIPSPQLVARTVERTLARSTGNDTGEIPTADLLAEGVMKSMTATKTTIWLLGGVVAMIATAGLMLAGGPESPSAKTTVKETPATKEAKPEAASDWLAGPTIETVGWLPVSLVPSRDAKFLAVGSTDGHVTCFDTVTRKPAWKADIGGRFAALALSEDGRTLYATSKDGATLLNMESGAILGKIAEPDSNPIAIGAFPDTTIPNGTEPLTQSKIVFGDATGMFVKSWIKPDQAGTIRMTAKANAKDATDPLATPLAVDPDGSSAILTGPVDAKTGRNVLWAYVAGNNGPESPGNRVLEGHTATVVSAAWSKNGSTAVTGDASGRVIVWNAKTMKETRRFELGGRVAALALSFGGTHAAAVVFGKTGDLYVWNPTVDAAGLKPIDTDTRDFQGVCHASLAFGPDGRELSACLMNRVWLTRLGDLTGKIRFWILRDDSKRAESITDRLQWPRNETVNEPQLNVGQVAFALDGKTFSVASRGTTLIYDSATLKKTMVLRESKPKASGNGTMTWEAKSMARIDPATGKEVPFEGPHGFVWQSQSVTRDGKYAVGFFEPVDAMAVGTGIMGGVAGISDDEIPKLAGAKILFPVTGVTWNPNSLRQEEGHAKHGLAVWETAKKGILAKRIRLFDTLGSEFVGQSNCYALSPDGKTIVFGGFVNRQEHATLTTFDLQTLKENHDRVEVRSRDTGADITALAWSPDGTIIACAVKNHSGKGPLHRIYLRDAKTLEVRETLLPQGEDVSAITTLAFSPDGRTLVGGTGHWPFFEGENKVSVHRIMVWRGILPK
jgi:RNA polymerase sigma factor (sigma-70 family)